MFIFLTARIIFDSRDKRVFSYIRAANQSIPAKSGRYRGNRLPGSKNSEFGGQSSACEMFDLQIRASPYRKFVED